MSVQPRWRQCKIASTICLPQIVCAFLFNITHRLRASELLNSSTKSISRLMAGHRSLSLVCRAIYKMGGPGRGIWHRFSMKSYSTSRIPAKDEIHQLTEIEVTMADLFVSYLLRRGREIRPSRWSEAFKLLPQRVSYVEVGRLRWILWPADVNRCNKSYTLLHSKITALVTN